jgi:hypothetical protein
MQACFLVLLEQAALEDEEAKTAKNKASSVVPTVVQDLGKETQTWFPGRNHQDHHHQSSHHHHGMQ